MDKDKVNENAKSKTPDSRREEETSQHLHNGDSSSGARQLSQQDGNQQIGTNRTDRQTTFGNASGKPDGGIIGQLEEIEQEYLAYISAHEERLKARLAEDYVIKQEAIAKIRRLKQEVIALLEKQE